MSAAHGSSSVEDPARRCTRSTLHRKPRAHKGSVGQRNSSAQALSYEILLNCMAHTETRRHRELRQFLRDAVLLCDIPAVLVAAMDQADPGINTLAPALQE